MAEPLIEAHALTKRFGDFVAVDGIDFEIQPGEAFGFLGPNGAGKSSTMRMIGCVSPVSGGVLRVLDLDPDRDGPQIRGRLGVVPQEDNLDTELTVWDNLMIYGRYFDLPRPEIRRRAEELLEFVQLADRRDSRVDPLSGGMKRRLTIARALINQPEVILLDEPTTGLDPQARHMLWERLYRLKQAGTTLVLTTHYMDEAEQLCDRLVIMDGGKIVAEGSPRDLVATHATREVVELRFNRAQEQNDALARVREIAPRVEPVADRLLVYTDDGDRMKAAIDGDGIGAASVLVRRASLEDVFLILTGRTLEDCVVATAPVLRVVEREVRVFSRLWRGFVFSLFLNPVLFLAAMGLGLGGLVDKHSGGVDGLTYLQYVTPGLLVAVASQLAAGESMWPIVGGVKWIGNFHATVATEITPAEVLYGCVLWIAIRAMVGSIAFVLVAAVLGGIPSAWGILAVPVAGLCAAAFSAPLTAYSVMQDSDVSFPLILRIGVLPLFLFSGTFYPISQLPAALQPIAQLSPLYHAVALARAATTGTFDALPDLVHLAVLVACILAGLAWGRRRFARRLAA